MLGRMPSANEVRDFALKCVRVADEELFRIYCYHCPPYADTQIHPLTGDAIDFSTTPVYRSMNKLLCDLELADNVALRLGHLSFDGWQIKRKAAVELVKTKRAVTAADFAPDLKQKTVDMKIGLDVAWLASNQIVDKLILVTADSDFVPAMKFARREGIQIVLVTLAHRLIKRELKVHADELCSVTYP